MSSNPAGSSSEPLFLNETNPDQLFSDWYSEAQKAEVNDPNALALATVDHDGLPNVRIVLMKGYDERGFVVYTNFDSQKGRELMSSEKAALNFHWKSLGRQVRVRGLVEVVSEREADAYYESRPLGSRIGAWASQQSRPLASRQELMERVAEFEATHGDAPTRPPHWSGFRVRPLSLEFWEEGAFRLHNRLRFDRSQLTAPWTIQRLYP